MIKSFFVSLALVFVSGFALANSSSDTGYVPTNGSNANFSANFSRGTVAHLRVKGLGDPNKSDLDCGVIYVDGDGDAHLLASDEDSTNLCLVTVTAPVSGRYELFVTNRGPGQRFEISLVTE